MAGSDRDVHRCRDWRDHLHRLDRRVFAKLDGRMSGKPLLPMRQHQSTPVIGNRHLCII
jgi:hypothetical protein